jgi:hypothetical protein
MQTRQQKDERELIRSYLLGGLDGARLEQFELRLLSDSRLQDALNAEQDELFDDYSFGLLSSGERERFERHFLAVPRRAERLFFAQAMKDYLGDESRRWGKKATGHASWRRTLLRPPARRKLAAGFAVAACLLATIAVFVWWDARQREAARVQLARRGGERGAALDETATRWQRFPRPPRRPNPYA